MIAGATVFVVCGPKQAPTEVPEPPGTWVTYGWLLDVWDVRRGDLDRWIRGGGVHWKPVEGAGQAYRWQDLEARVMELNALEVERALDGKCSRCGERGCACL